MIRIFGFTADLNAFRMFDRATYQERTNEVSTLQLLQGSARWDRVAGRLEFGSSVGLERGGVSGRVFVDENANGTFDQGEIPVPNVRMIVGSEAQRTDSDGRFSVWDLVAFEPTRVSIDSLSVPNPLWVPAVSLAEIPVGPSTYRAFDVPLTMGGEISGRVFLDQNGGIGGVRLILANTATGQERVITTFSDGEFYAFGVRPGDYELRVDPGPLEALNLRSEISAILFSVETVAGGDRVSDLFIRLVRTNGQ